MSGRNVSVSMVARIIGMITSFVGRSMFVRFLGTEYLGLGGFFGNIFSLVSLCELGMGAAVAQSLYKPLSTGDGYSVSAIVSYYSRFCRIVAIVSTLVSLAAMPVLPHFVKTNLAMTEIYGAYLLFVVHSGVSYLFLPKRCLVVCDQKMYVATFYRCIFSIIGLFFQCFVLIVTKNYLLYLAVRILVICADDVTINRYADRNYPYLEIKNKVSNGYKSKLFDNVKALMWHKIGGVVSRSTDSLLLTYFVGLSGMGKYSNYALIIGTVGAFFDVAVNAVGASVGNLGAVDRGIKSETVLRRIYFINFWLLTVGTSIFVSTLNPFIELWLGREMLFSNGEMFVIVASFYFSCIRDPVEIFVSTYGLFKESRHIPILRAMVNLVLSCVFVVKMGVTGVFLGTVLSIVTVPLFGEIRVLYKHGFSLDPTGFYKQVIGYILVSAISVFTCFFATYYFGINGVGIVARCLVSLCVSNGILLVTNGCNEFFCDTLSIVVKSFGKMWQKSTQK